MIVLDCSAPATDPPVAPFGSGVKHFVFRGAAELKVPSQRDGCLLVRHSE